MAAPKKKAAQTLKDQVLAALATSTDPLTTSELHDVCDLAVMPANISTAVHGLFTAGRIVRVVKEGRFAYQLPEQSKVGADEGSGVVPIAKATGDDAAPSGLDPDPLPKPCRTDRVVQERKPAQPRAALYDQIARVLSDIDTIASDALDVEVDADVLRCVIAGQGSLRRAQEAIYRGLQG